MGVDSEAAGAVAVKDESTDDEKGVDLGKDELEDDDSDGYYSEDDKTWLAIIGHGGKETGHAERECHLGKSQGWPLL